jgi:hypothetical protein
MPRKHATRGDLPRVKWIHGRQSLRIARQIIAKAGMLAAKRLATERRDIMKNSFIRALTLGLVVAFPAAVLAGPKQEAAPKAEKKEKTEKKTEKTEKAAGGEKTEKTEKTEKATKKSKKEKAGEAAPANP